MLYIETAGSRRDFVAKLTGVILLLVILISGTVKAENHESFDMPYHLSAVIADTNVSGEGENATLGIDIEYRVNQLLGLGAVFEYAWGELDATTVLAVADIHLVEGWVMQVGPGVEHRHSEEVFVSRVGLLYEFEWDHYTFSPQLHWDFHDGEENAVVAGFAVGFSF